MTKTTQEAMADLVDALTGLGRACGKSALSLTQFHYVLDQIYAAERLRQRGFRIALIVLIGILLIALIAALMG